MHSLYALVFTAMAAEVTGSGLMDNPIVGNKITYLDGDDWTASMTTRGTCKFIQDVDYDHGSLGPLPMSGVANKEACCQQCWMSSHCAAAVFASGSCWMKTASQLTKPSTRTGVVACAKYQKTEGFTIAAKVPGDLISDLYAAGQIGNPLYEKNWLNSSIWNDHEWTYATEFEADSSSLLVFDGIKMGAKIRVNGVEIGQATDQFARYTFALNEHPGLIKNSSNILEVLFVGSLLNCGGRWMACTGGWDWAPYTNTQQEGIPTFTKGIWKSVYTVSVQNAAIEHFVPQVFYQGGHPTATIEDGTHAGFKVHARVHLWAQAATKGTLTVTGSWGALAKQVVNIPAGASNLTLILDASAKDTKLWWPAGLGAQHTFEVKASLSIGSGLALETSRKIGFRHVALVTGNDTDASYVAKASKEEGTDGLGMFFRVNGAAIMSKGANMIPMEELEGWMDADAHRILVKSAVEAKMNTLRVWGGGMFLPDAWYDACDELGILVYHDMQYAQGGHDPRGTSEEEAELRHIIRRLSHHPSIMVWDGCNECQVKMNSSTAIYATFVMTIVAEEDASRIVWPSCPALGWTTGVHKLNSMPNGNTLTTPDSGSWIETHGPYQHGTGFPAVNGAEKLDMFDSNIPLKLKEGKTGVAEQNVFASEFGGVVMSSFESMSPTLAPEHWALHAGQPSDTCSGGFSSHCEGPNVMAERNYPCDNFIYVYFGTKGQEFNVTGEFNFKKQLYQCMTAQALQVKQNIESRLSQNTFGIIIWQYNEIWPTGGWGSIEYGNPKFTGQVIGGRWKPLQYWYSKSIFADVMATCGTGGECYIRNDAPKPFKGTLTLRSTAFSDGKVNVLLKRDVSLLAGAGSLQWFHSDEVAALDGTTHILESIVTAIDGSIVSSNTIPFTTPEKMKLAKASVKVSAVAKSNGEMVAQVTTDAVAMYVTLTTLAHGRFEDNSFLLLPPGREVKFLPATPSPHESLQECYRTFADSVRVEDVSVYQPSEIASELVI